MKRKVECWVGESLDGCFATLRLYVDGDLLVEGYYGGEPEDNSRTRGYCWVETALKRLAEALGAEYETLEGNDE